MAMNISNLMRHISLSMNNKEISVPFEITFSLGMNYAVMESTSDILKLNIFEIIFP